MPEVIIAGSTVEFDTIQAGNCMAVGITGNTVRMGVSEEALLAKVKSSLVYSINGVYPTSDGSFFIHGSDCDSWGYVNGGIAEITGSTAATVSVGASTASGIWLTDLCPACQTCDEIFRIKQEIEKLAVLVNMIKDVEIHDDAVFLSDKSDMEALELNGSTVNCAVPWGTQSMNFPVDRGRQLLQQYITVAHMWNYAVVQNNASFKLEIAPEDTAGFVVQTKRALPNCDGHWHIRCTITIEYENSINDDGAPMGRVQDLSVYVPEPELLFKPFTEYREEQPDVGLPEVVNGSTVYVMDAALNGAKAHVDAAVNCTKKTIMTDEIVARVGGTYEVTVKILPFINFVMYDKDNHVISVRGGTISIDGTTVTVPGSTTSNVYYDFAPTLTERKQLQRPTKDDYLNAKTAPTASVPFNNIWRVNILWEVSRDDYQEDETELLFTEIATAESDIPGNAKPTVAFSDIKGQEGGFRPAPYFKYEENRLYTCTGAREPNTQAIISNSTIPVDIPAKKTKG